MGGVKPKWHDSIIPIGQNQAAYLNCREQGNALIERQFTAILKIGNDKRARVPYPGIEARSEFLDTGRLVGTNLVSVSALAIMRLLDFRPLLEFAIST
jgi:hypothetical protein